MGDVDRDRVAANWAARGFGCDLWMDPPGRTWEDFVHPTDEVVMVLEGEQQFEVEGVIHRPRAGEELLIPAGAVHSARNVGPTTSRWLYGYRAS
jgi:mannose-6-phosphate isomerase-like protein (cupin superfamily)